MAKRCAYFLCYIILVGWSFCSAGEYDVVTSEDLDIPLIFNGEIVNHKMLPAGTNLKVVDIKGSDLVCQGERRRFSVPIVKTNFLVVREKIRALKDRPKQEEVAQSSSQNVEGLVQTLQKLVVKAKEDGKISPKSVRFRHYSSREIRTPFLMVKPLGLLTKHPDLDPSLVETLKTITTAVNCYRVGSYARYEQILKTLPDDLGVSLSMNQKEVQ